jgi:hypothetical protein
MCFNKRTVGCTLWAGFIDDEQPVPDLLLELEMKTIINRPFLHWLRKAEVFFACCLGTAALMRVLVLKYDLLFTLPFAFLSLLSGAVLGWCALWRWRFVAPLRCAAELGICAGIGGLGLYILFAYLMACLFTPQNGLVQSL